MSDRRSPLDDAMTIKQAAQVLKVSQPTVYRLIRAGRLVAIRHVHHTLVEPAAIEDYVARLRAEGQKACAERARAQRPRRLKAVSG